MQRYQRTKTHTLTLLYAVFVCFSATVAAADSSLTPVVNADSLPLDLSMILRPSEEGVVPDAAALLKAKLTEQAPPEFMELPTSVPQRWFLANLDLSLYQRRDMVIVIDRALMERADIFVLSGDDIIFAGNTGTTIPLSALNSPDRVPVAEFNVPSSAKIVSFLINTTSLVGDALPVLLMEQADYVSRSQRELIFGGAFLTTLALSLFLSIAFYRRRPDRLMLSFGLFCVSNIFLFLTITGAGKTLLWNESSEASIRVFIAAGSLVTLSLACINLRTLKNKVLRLALKSYLTLVYCTTPFIFCAALLAPYEFPSRYLPLPLLILCTGTSLTAVLSLIVSRKIKSGVSMYLNYSWLFIAIAYLLLATYRFQLFIPGQQLKIIAELSSIGALLLLLLAISASSRSAMHKVLEAKLTTRTRSLFLSELSSTFRRPIFTILRQTSRVKKEFQTSVPAPVITYFESVEHHSLGLKTLLDDLIELSTIDSNVSEQNLELTNIRDLLGTVQSNLSHKLKEKQTLVVNTRVRNSLTLLTKQHQLEKVITGLTTGLLSNFNGCELRIECEACYVGLKVGVKFKIRAVGALIDTRYMAQLHFVLNAKLADLVNSTHAPEISLVILRQLLEQLQGESSFQHSAADGALIVIRIPLRHGSARATSQAA